MAKSRARLVIWCLVLASVGFELAKWRRSGNGTRATSVGPHLGGAHHFVDGRIRTHASAQALLERARPAHAVDPETDGEPSERERPREEAKTRKDRKDHGALVPEESSGKTQPPGNVSASCLGVAGVEYAGEVVEGGPWPAGGWAVPALNSGAWADGSTAGGE